MVKSIVFCSMPKFLWLFKSFTIYIRSSFSNKTRKGNIVVQDDIFTAENLSDYQASSIEKNLLERLVSKSQVKFLSDWGGEDYANFLVGRQALKDIYTVYESINYVELVYSKYRMFGTVYFFPLNFSLVVFDEMVKMNLIPAHIKMHFAARIYLHLYNTTKYSYFILRMLFYPESVLFRFTKKGVVDNNEFDFIAYLDDGLVMPNTNSIDINNRVLRLFEGRKVLFVDDRHGKGQLWPELTRKLGKLVLRLEDVASHTPKKEYLANYYVKLFKWRCQLVLLSLQHSWMSPACSRAMRLRLLWDLFYSRYSSNMAIRMMVEENLTSLTVHKQHNVKTLFVYFSTTEDTKPKIKDNKFATNHDYVHMMADCMVSSAISNTFFKESDNKINEYVVLGPMFSDLVHESKIMRDTIKESLGIDKSRKVITFFDHTIGYKKVLNFKAYKLFLQSIIDFSRNNRECLVIFKSKKSLSVLELETNQTMTSLIDLIKKQSNCIYANDDLQLNPMELIGISNVVVSAPMSSIIFESLMGGVRCVSYDPLGQYKNHKVLSQGVLNLNATSHSDLEKLIDYWLNHCSDAEFDTFISTHIKPFVDPECETGGMIEKFQKKILL